MTNLTADTIHATKPGKVGARRSVPVKDAIQLYAGALVGYDLNGVLDNWDDVASSRFLGLLLESALGDSTPAAGSPRVRGRIDTGGATLTGLTVLGTPTAAKVGDLVYAADGNVETITLTSATSVAIGIMTDYTSATSQEVTLFTPEESEAKV